MAELSDSIPVQVEQADGSYKEVPLGEAVRLGLMDGLKVEVHGTGIVTNPDD